MTQRLPFQVVLSGYDGSPGGRDALALGALLAGGPGRLVAARVFPAEPRLLPGPAVERYRSRHAAEHNARLAELDQVAEQFGADPVGALARSPAAGLHDLAVELEAKLLVIGSSDRNPRRLGGGTGERLLHGSPCAVALVPLGFRERDQRLRVVGVAYDGSPEADVALGDAIALAENHEATMRIFTIVPPTGPLLEAGAAISGRDYYEQASRAAQQRAPERVRAATAVVSGDPAAVLRGEAEKGLDLLALGSRGFGPLRRAFSGSVAALLTHGLACPLLVCPRGAEQSSRVHRLAAHPAPE